MSKTLLKQVLGKIVTDGQLLVGFADGEIAEFGRPAAGYPNVTIRFADRRVPRDIVLDPRLGVGEAYMDGRLIVEEGDILDLVTLFRANTRWEDGRRIAAPATLRRLRETIEFAVSQINNATSSKRNVAAHYDIGNALYELMLDAEHMQYSCAYWPRDDMTLAQAQEAKLAHITAKLSIEPGNEILDIGCGWGGMAIYLARHFDCRVTGITLSEEQAALARERVAEAGLADRITIELTDYRDIPGQARQFDRIVSVGMFEHVGRSQFDTFFRTCAEILRPKGVMLLHSIVRFGPPGSTDAFTRKYIFPGGYIPALSETLAASEKYRLIASDVEVLRVHYAKTLREWYRRCMAHREEIEALFDARFFRMWTFYLAGAATVFEYGGMGNFQIQYVRDRHAVPLTRDYMGEAESSLLPVES
ncbi:methyltransferase domain-containing protein [Erythrobacter sp. 3-20A1M]|uniref:SAM-dependent methyltransferase n=1 Tax=Erythrobacter sp. 3-20A1M TaxID=2653850 RepID=UPI001BFCB4A7|nr:cyclopropane-fatty-acyl-phospholipid synthase family protein [Erythrobacter sp. 3-20A1M]QWC55884.1 methyltransferase domain-containing protein [Erythrobacter sp. 3-20A1M]